MAASPLVAALMGGGGGGNEAAMFGLDPTTMQAMPDIQIGQALQQQGLSTAPASPMQALARIFQAGTGGYLARGGMSDLAKAYATSADSMAQIFPAGTPIGDGLRSPNPMVRMQALQQAPKAMLLNTEQKGLRPGEENYSGTHRIAVNQQPRSPEGVLAHDQTAATGVPITPLAAAYGHSYSTAAGKAPFEPGGEGQVNTPQGVKELPLTAETRARMQPGGGLGPTPLTAVQPPAAQQPPAPQAQAAPGGKDQSAVPPGTPIPGQQPVVTGKPAPNSAITPLVDADAKELAADRQKALLGQGDMANVRMIQDFMPKVKTGWSAETKLEGARILKSLGVSDDQIKSFADTDVAAGQILQKKFVELSAAAARTMGAREPGSVIAMFSKAYPNLGTDPQAVALQTNALYMDRLRSQHLAEQKTNYLHDSVDNVQSTGQYRGLKGFNENFNKTNPPEYYLHAAEAMSGASEPWKRITSTPQRNAIIRLMPPGTQYLGPDNKTHVTPGSGVQSQ